MAQCITIDCRTERTGIVARAVERLAETVGERSGLAAGENVGGGATVVLDIAPGEPPEGFRIEDAGGAVAVVGGDERGLLYGVGRLLRDARFGPGEFAFGPWRGASAPARDVRGIYFATHFHNFYHEAPINDVCRYVEDLALWGCNTLSVWFDMHHYTGMDDPAARAMIERLRTVLQAGRAVGIRPALTTLANEAYADSPEHLRADWTAGHDGYTTAPGGHYHVEICPSRPGGLDLILRRRREMLQAFADLDIEYVWIWPYDQGGCTCGRCAPWGANGFLRVARPEAEVIRSVCPAARIVLSTWYFDRFTSGEWEGLARAFEREPPDWADYLLVDDYGTSFPRYPLEHGSPGGLPMVNFPEISMYDMWPWGGYGMNPLPGHLQAIWDECGPFVAGGFPYSEGIFEDINKAVILQFYWDPARTAAQTVREYVSAAFSPDAADDLCRAVELMEAGHSHRPAGEEERSAAGDRLYVMANTRHSEECLALVEKAERGLTDAVRRSWRWRTFYLRAAIDAEIARNAGRPTDRLDAMFDELGEIYAAHRALPQVAPPGRAALDRLRRGS
jgi:hypothetical protein